jgi:8-oxo-dGTP pyrophosphatase MutT (NUDIX family)
MTEEKEKKEEFCNNCGNKGHIFRECEYPKTSYGIICKKTDTDKDEDKFLLICRRCSLSYIEFIRGRYKLFDSTMLFTLFKHMTIKERNDLLTKTFDELWDELWINNKYKKTDIRSDYEKGKELYRLLKEGVIIVYQNILVTLEYILRNTYSIYEEPEWNFPKGRRNMLENDIECAVREFCEETNLKKEDIELIDDEPFIEIHKGTNGLKYRTVYFLANIKTDKELKIDKTNKNQIMEISKIGWFSYEETLSKFREYDTEKKTVITNVYKKLNKNKNN